MSEVSQKPERQKIKESLARIHLGRAAVAFSAVAIPAAAASELLHSPYPAYAGAAMVAIGGAETAWDFILNRNRSTEDLNQGFSRWLARDETE